PLEQATYQFFPGWQSLTDLQIDLLFQNASLDMQSRATKLGQARSDAVHAWIPSLTPGGHLFVDANILGDGQEITDYLQNSPLSGSVGRALQQVQIRGPMTGSVKLDIPLDGKSEVKAHGDATFINNQVRVASLDLPLEQVQGRLEYDNQQTRFSNLKASLWNQPLTVNYQGRKYPDHYQVDLDFNGRWDSERQLPAISALHILNGRSNWSGKVGVTLPVNKPFSFQLALESNLQGMGLALPVPLTKAPQSQLPLKVVGRGRDGHADLRAVLGMDVDMQARLEYGAPAPHLSRVRVDVGQPGNRVLHDAPMLVTINQQEADVGGWLARISQWLAPQTSHGPAAVPPAFLPTPWWVDGQLARAHLGGATLNAVRFSVGPTNRATEVMIDSPDVMGVIHMPVVKNRPIEAQFARIYWPAKGTGLALGSDATQDRAIMAAIPWLQFSCVDCRFGALPLGELKGELLPSPNKLSLKQFDMQLEGSQLTGSVDWLADGNRMQTRAHGKLTSNNSELLIKRLGYTSPIGDAPGSLKFDLNWQDVPYRPNMPTLGGSASFALESGTLRDINNKWARLLALLSVDSLLRKLHLDFRDVFDKGFFFESISASATVKQGQVSNHDLYMKGAAGNLHGKGVADLVHRQLNFNLSFSPNLGGTLPVVAAFAIKPLTGIYVFALSKLLEPVVDVVTRINFEIAGPFNNPQLIEAGREQTRIKLDPQQIKATTPALPAVTPFVHPPSPVSPH
ncbi:MAG: YhdP family protein, partial [Aeromonas sp.]